MVNQDYGAAIHHSTRGESSVSRGRSAFITIALIATGCIVLSIALVASGRGGNDVVELMVSRLCFASMFPPFILFALHAGDRDVGLSFSPR